MPVTGEDIPAELFETVLKFLVDPMLKLRKDGIGGVDAKKRELSSLSLVSKYWAKTCRPKLFTTITLRSADDIYTLMSFLDNPTSRLAEYISILRVASVKTGQIPWIHLLPLLYPRLSNEQWFLDVEVEGPFSMKNGGLRSIHRVARPVPSFSQHIASLKLINVTFRRFADFVALVEELRSLKHLVCRDLTWPRETVPPTLAQRRAHAQFNEASMTDCTSNWRIMWLMAGYYRPREPPWRRDDWDAFLPLLCSLESGLPAKCTNRMLRVTDRVSPSVQYSGSIAGIPRQTPCITTICNNDEGDCHRRIVCLTVDFVHGLEPEPAINFDDAMQCDWPAFDHNLCRMLALQKIVFGFRSMDDFLKFREFVLCTMSLLIHCGKFSVVYAVWKAETCPDSFGGTWQYFYNGSNGASELRDSGMIFLDEVQ